ncbi:MAG: protein phosphatase 2C domain-containing protein [Pseudomonadota bacterium]
MNDTPNIRFDVASVLNRGCRDYQEDAIATDFPMGADFGYAVLSDGMGGHAAGDVASKIVVTEVFSELKFQSSNPETFEENISEVLKTAAVSANECMAAHATSNPDTAGMGATLVAPVIVGDCLYWISIGDSPLYLMRNGRLRQLNEDHSLGPHIDYMVRSGMMSEDVGRNHPDRNALTSVLIGETIERIDCPEVPVRLQHGDILIVASDGLQFLSNREITDIVLENTDAGSDTIAETLLQNLRELDDPEQDNVCFSVIKVSVSDTEAEGNVFAHDVEPHKPSRPRVTTRPIRVAEMEPTPEPEPAAEDDEDDGWDWGDDFDDDDLDKTAPAASASPPPAQQNGSGGDTTPIFLRRRWLATDG